MDTEIKAEKWSDFFEILSKRRYEWTTSVEVLSPEIGDQILSDGLSFNGITMEKGEDPAINISLGEAPEAHQNHRIAEPTKVVFLEADKSHGNILEIEQKDGSKTLVTFVEPKGIIVDFPEFEGVAAIF